LSGVFNHKWLKSLSKDKDKAFLALLRGIVEILVDKPNSCG
jgi:hypothetical protein